MAKKKGKEKKTYRKNEVRQLIQGLFYNQPKRTFNYKQVAGLLDVKKQSGKQMVQVILNELFESGYLTEVAVGKYKLMSRGSTLTGTIDMTSTGNAYVVPDDEGQDVFIARSNMNTAMHG
ncbi:MAG: ribonuclease R, partial [Marinilabiliaceae bacterium]|nr:ribonuclease R [Marinilabiliaceae bacterium]